MMIYGIGFAILFPSINALLVENTTDDNRGKAFGLFYAFFSLGVVAGSFTVGAIGASPQHQLHYRDSIFINICWDDLCKKAVKDNDGIIHRCLFLNAYLYNP